MPPPRGLGGGFSDGNPMIAPFSDGHPQIGRRLAGKKQALEALGVYHLVADLRVPGQLASETSAEPAHPQGAQSAHCRSPRSRRVDEADRQARERWITAARIVHRHRLGSCCHSRPHRNRRGKDRGRADSRGPGTQQEPAGAHLDAIVRAIGLIETQPPSSTLSGMTGSCRCCPLSPSATTWTR